MKLSDFKQAVKIRWKIISSCTMFTFRESLAYTINNYGNLLSMVTYMVTYLIFINVLFARVKVIAGYTFADMLLFTLIGQINYYTTFVFSLGSIDRLDREVNTGELDLWLIKPVPSLWFVTFQRINLGELVFSAFPATIPLLVLLADKWPSFHVRPAGLAAGVLCMILGQIIVHCFQFMVAMTVFFTGEGKNAKNMAIELTFFGDLPLEAYPRWLKYIGFSIVPFLIYTALATSFILGKSTDYSILYYLTGLTAVFLWGKSALWKLAMKHYSSASS